MNTQYKVIHNNQPTLCHSADEAIAHIRSLNLKNTEEVVVEEIKIKDVSDTFKTLTQSAKSLAEVRAEATKGLKPLKSIWLDEDLGLPYSPFSLLYDISSVGQLAFQLQRDGSLNIDLLEDAMEYGFSAEYLESLTLKDPYAQ